MRENFYPQTMMVENVHGSSKVEMWKEELDRIQRDYRMRKSLLCIDQN
jgi:hypothetical protein